MCELAIMFVAAIEGSFLLSRAAKSTESNAVIAALESITFDTVYGPLQYRKEDHQLLQPMYGFKIKVDPNVPWAIPELTHVITMDEMKIPIANKR